MPITKSALTRLETMRSLLAKNWVQGWMAQNSAGAIVSPTDPYAAGWTMTGAFVAAYEPLELDDEETWVWAKLVALTGSRSINEWNDAKGRTQAEVLSIMDQVTTELNTLLSNVVRKPRVTKDKAL